MISYIVRCGTLKKEIEAESPAEAIKIAFLDLSHDVRLNDFIRISWTEGKRHCMYLLTDNYLKPRKAYETTS